MCVKDHYCVNIYVCKFDFIMQKLFSYLDIDECEHGISGCSQNCANTNGSFVCSCQMGYNLSAVDQKTCLGIIHLILYSKDIK